MKELADTMHRFGYMFGIHDQYRDFYEAAPSFDENYALPFHRRHDSEAQPLGWRTAVLSVRLPGSLLCKTELF